MRADRLIALLLLLQRRGRITAAEAAAELEVSPRTARRDLEALAMSGVPVYSRHGRGGGWELIGGAKTDLTGLSADEARALFLASGHGPFDGPELRSALRKLTAALPSMFRADAEAATAAITVDPDRWGRVSTGPGRPRHLATLTQAVIAGHRIDLTYESPRSGPSLRVVSPLGLVTKGNVWYLVAGVDDAQTRTFRVSRVQAVEIRDEPAVRPPDFDLDRAWDQIVTQVEALRGGDDVRVAVDPQVMGGVRWSFGAENVTIEPTQEAPDPAMADEEAAWPIARIRYTRQRAFVGMIAGFGDRVRLLDAPPDILDELGLLARQLVRRYG